MHWSDVMAQRLAQRGDKHIVATGITPSGEFHIGHLREILTGDMIARAARRAGMDRTGLCGGQRRPSAEGLPVLGREL